MGVWASDEDIRTMRSAIRFSSARRLPCSTIVDLFRERNTRSARRIPRDLWRVVQRKLKLIDAAGRLDDLAVPAGHRLELMKGDHVGRRSIRVNEQYRVTLAGSRDSTRRDPSRGVPEATRGGAA
jgi:plasmid maintenance system killer protein